MLDKETAERFARWLLKAAEEHYGDKDKDTRCEDLTATADRFAQNRQTRLHESAKL